MLRKGYMCITFWKRAWDIRKRAEETNRTMREYVEYLPKKGKASKKGH